MGKKDRNHRMSFKCPSCQASIQTRNTKPKCFHCNAALEVIETNPKIVVRVRKKKERR